MKKEITGRHIGEFDEYCVGCFDPFYAQAFVTSVGKSKIKLTEQSSLLDELNAYDHAELDTVYLGQINAITVTSFCGKDGLVWGYDAYPSKDLHKDFLFTVNDHLGNAIKVYSAAPLVEAAKSLFGTKDNKKFNLIHGSLTPAAQRKVVDKGPKTIYGGLALGIAKDRKTNVDLIMEDIGELSEDFEKKDISEVKDKLLRNLAKSIMVIGENHGVEFSEIFVNFEYLPLETDEMGCVLLIAPYFKLAKNSIFENRDLTLEEWNHEVKGKYGF
ncbi:MAG: histidine decarboxylase, pyruvoyl type [bacterium]